MQQKMLKNYSVLPETSPLIELQTLAAGSERNQCFTEPTLLYLFSGKLTLSHQQASGKELPAGSFTLIPAGINLRLRAKSVAPYISIRFRRQGNLLRQHHYMFNRLSGNNPHYLLSETSTASQTFAPASLKATVHVQNFMNGLRMYIEAGIRINDIYENKVKELFFLLRLSYTGCELEKLFLPIYAFIKDKSFMDYIEANHHKYTTVSEFAQALNYSYSGFTKKFRQVFGEPAYQWMKKKKAQEVYSEISQSRETSLKEISFKFGFPSLPGFYKFCRTNFGRTPGEIRKGFTTRTTDLHKAI